MVHLHRTLLGTEPECDGRNGPTDCGRNPWSEQEFNGFLELAPDAVVIADGDGRIIRVNAQAEKLFGYPRGELLGREVEILIPERFRGRHVGQRTAYFANPDGPATRVADRAEGGKSW